MSSSGAAGSFDNLYDYLGLDPIFDDLNAFGRANRARLEALPAPSGDPAIDRIEAAFEALDEALDDDVPFPDCYCTEEG